MAEPIVMELGMNIMLSKPISAVHVIIPFDQYHTTNIMASQISQDKPYYFPNACTNLHGTW
jgi:hypothetical protein